MSSIQDLIDALFDLPPYPTTLADGQALWEPALYALRRPVSGFVDRDDSTITFVEGTRTLTVAPVGASFTVYVDGAEYVFSTPQSVVLPDVTALYYIHVDNTGAFTYNTSQWDYSDETQAPVAAVFWRSDYARALWHDKRYTAHMPWRARKYARDVLGTRYLSGLAGSFAAGNTFSVAEGEIADGDITYSIPASTTCIRMWLSATPGLVDYSAPGTGYMSISGGGVLQYNDSAGSITDVTDGYYVAIWVWATADGSTPIWVTVPQRQDATLAQAMVNNTYSSLDLTVFGERAMKLLYRVIVQRSGASEYVSDVTDFRSMPTASSLDSLQIDHGSLITDDNVDHPGHLLANGTRTLSANWDAGSYQIRALQFYSDATTGVAPLAVNSTTKVTNLNADYLDGLSSAAYVQADGSIPMTGTLTGTNIELTASTTEQRSIEVGKGRSGNGYAFLDLVGDATYTDYGLRVIRNNSGANTNSEIIHRGSGTMLVNAPDGGLIQLTSPRNGAFAVDIRNTYSAAGGGGITVCAGVAGAAVTMLAAFNYDGGTLWGYIENTAGGTFQLVDASDERLKKDIADADVDALDKIKKLKVREYRFKHGNGDKVKAGFVAQEAEQVIPEMVSTAENGQKGTARTALIPYLVKATQQLLSRVEALESELATMRLK